MTLARYLATGSGRLEFRLAIEGWPHEFVTQSSMEKTVSGGTYDGRIRLSGMLRDGIGWSEECDPARSELEGKGFTVKIVDNYAGEVMAALIERPTADAFLTSTQDASTKNFNVTDTSGFSAGDYLHIGTEVVYVNSKTATTFNANRGQWGTAAQYHYCVGDGEVSAAYVANRPAGLEGRRVELYAYGEGDDPQGNGTVVFYGVCGTDAKLADDGVTWSFVVEHCASLLKQKFGDDVQEPVGLRGIFYPLNDPLHVEIQQHTSNNGFVGVDEVVTLAVSGFWATQQDFCTSLTDAVDALVSGWTSYGAGMRLRAEPYGDQWHWVIEPGTGGSVRMIDVLSYSNVDLHQGGKFGNGWWDGVDETSVPIGGFTSAAPMISRGIGLPVDLFWDFDGTKASGHGISRAEWREQSSTVPRGTVGGWMKTGFTAAAAGVTQLGDYSGKQIQGRSLWLDRAIDTPVNAHAIAITQVKADGTVLAERNGMPGTYDAGEYLITLTNIHTEELHYFGDAIRIECGLQFGVRHVDLEGFREWLFAQGPQYTNAGSFPLLLENQDFSSRFDTTVTRVTKGRPWAKKRDYMGRKSREIGEVMREDLKLIGCFLAADAWGRISAERMVFVAPTQTLDATFGSSTILVDRGFPEWELAGRSGYINACDVLTGYNHQTDKHEGSTITIRDVASISEHKLQGTVKIKPASVGSTVQEDWSAITEIWGPLLGFYGGPTAHLTFETTLAALQTTRLGACVQVVSDRIPDPITATRGATVAGVVISRHIELSEGRMRIGVLTSYVNAAGYAPTAYVSSASGSGTSWTLTVSESAPDSGPAMYGSGKDPDDHFAVGDKIVLWQWDTTSTANRRTGTISSASSTQLGVTLDSSWTGLGGNIYCVSYDDATTIGSDISQEAYAFVAGSDGLIDFTTDAPARRFAP